MRVYPPGPSTALVREWVLLCEECGERETYPMIFGKEYQEPMIDRLATLHVCGGEVHTDWSEDRFLIPASHPGYAGHGAHAPVQSTLAEHIDWMFGPFGPEGEINALPA